jgi:hypothetical protein
MCLYTLAFQAKEEEEDDNNDNNNDDDDDDKEEEEEESHSLFSSLPLLKSAQLVSWSDSLESSVWKSSLKNAKRPRLDQTITGKDWKIEKPEKTKTVVQSLVHHHLKFRETGQRPVSTNWDLSFPL